MLGSSLVASGLACGSPAPDPVDGSVPVGGTYFCGYFREQRVVCDDPTFNRWESLPGCEVVEPGTNCLDVVPPDVDWRPGPSSGCENYLNYGLSDAHGTSSEPLRGDCDHWQRWFGGAIDCFNDATCADNETCVADVCHCGEVPLPSEMRRESICDGLDAVEVVRTCGAERVIIEAPEVYRTCEPPQACVVLPEGFATCE